MAAAAVRACKAQWQAEASVTPSQAGTIQPVRSYCNLQDVQLDIVCSHLPTFLVDITYYAPASIAGALSDDARLTSVAYIRPKSRTELPGKIKIGT